MSESINPSRLLSLLSEPVVYSSIGPYITHRDYLARKYLLEVTRDKALNLLCTDYNKQLSIVLGKLKNQDAAQLLYQIWADYAGDSEIYKTTLTLRTTLQQISRIKGRIIYPVEYEDLLQV